MSQQHDDEFSYDDTPSGGAQTFADQQPTGAGASGGGFDDLPDAPADIPPEPTSKTKLTGEVREVALISGKDGTTKYLKVKFKADSASAFPGFECELFGPVVGGDVGSRKRHMEALSKLAKQASADWRPEVSLKASVQALAGIKGQIVSYEVKPKKKAGEYFVDIT